MNGSRITRFLKAVILASMASLMVAGFLLVGGLGSSSTAEAHNNCRRLSLLRCQPRYETQTIVTTIPR